MAYATANQIRRMAKTLTSTRISDAIVTDSIEQATAKLNRDIGVRKENVEIGYIDVERENTLDGSNKTFYIADVYRDSGNYLGDYDNDGDVDTSDVAIYSINSSGTKTTYTVSTVDATLGKITLSTAPSLSETLYASYIYFPLPYNHALVTQACRELTASYCFDYLEFGQVKQIREQGTAYYRHTDAGKEMMKRYRTTVNEIIASRLSRVDKTSVRIPEVGE